MSAVATNESMGLRVGTAVVDITPRDLAGLNAMGDDFLGVHDRLHARVVVIENGADVLAVVSAELLEIADAAPLRARIEAETGIPATAVLAVATHTHNAPRAGQTPAGGLSRPASPESLAYTGQVFAAITDAVRDARDTLRPARFGVGHGQVDVNLNRDELVGGRWVLGRNPSGPSDKTLTVLSFTEPDGIPIATLLGYAVHPTVSLGTRLVGADLAGTAVSAVERDRGGVTLWLPGSIGDQAPRRSREFATQDGVAPDDAEVYAAVTELGETVAAEAVRVASLVDGVDDVTLASADTLLDCPPKRGTDLAPDMRQADVDHVALPLSVLRIGPVALLGVGGEVTTLAAEQILAASPAEVPVLVSIANARFGYLADSVSFARGSFPARGCPVAAEWLPGAARALAELAATSVIAMPE